jgi:trk system potassium uptake protein TrkA
MYAVIVGAGEVGLHIAGFLCQEGQKVALVERDALRVAKVGEQLDVFAVVGNGASKRVLLDVDIGQADILVAVADSDEVNMIACMVAKSVGVPLTVARIRNADYLGSADSVSSEFTGIDHVIQPEAAVAEEIGGLADHPGALEVETFAGGQALMLEVKIAESSRYAGRALGEMDLPRQALVTGVLGGNTMIVPRGHTVLNPGDRVFLAGQPSAVREAAALLTMKTRMPKTAILLGCGDTGLPVARALESRGLRLTVFEKDYERSVAAASVLDRAMVLHDEGLAEGVLLAEGVRDVDMFIAATGDDRLNILASLQAKRLGADRAIAILERSEFSEVLEATGIDVAISPRRLTASAVLRLIRAGRVMSAAVLDKSAGEVLEFLVAEDSRVVGVPLREIPFPAGSILAILKRSDGVQVARGDTVPQAGDIAVVFAATDCVPAVEKLFVSRRPRLRR